MNQTRHPCPADQTPAAQAPQAAPLQLSRRTLNRRTLGAWSLGAISAVGGALSGAGLLGSAPAHAQRISQLPQAAKAPAPSGVIPQEGLDYIKLDRRVPSPAPAGKIEVIEFFWYHCPHCNHFEPTLQKWLKRLPKDISFQRVPVAFREEFEPDQKLFYALEALGQLGRLHSVVFDAVHNKKIDLSTREKIIDWIATQGIDKTQFTAMYDSLTVATKLKQAMKLQRAYDVRGVPSLGVAGQFYTDGSLAQGMERALEIVDYLVSQQRKIQNKNKTQNHGKR